MKKLVSLEVVGGVMLLEASAPSTRPRIRCGRNHEGQFGKREKGS